MNAYKYLVGQPKGRYNLEDLSLEGRAVLKYILNKQGVRVWIGSSRRNIGSNCVHCEQGELIFASMKCGKILIDLNDC
jgi:hypothetical protein